MADEFPREMFEELHALRERWQTLLPAIVERAGHGPFTYRGETFIIARTRSGEWAVKRYEPQKPKLVE